MKFTDLQKIVEDLDIKYPNEWAESILGPTSIEYPIENHFVFVGDKKFLKKLEENIENPAFQNMGVIVDAQLFEDKSESFDKLKEKIGYIVTTSSIPKSIIMLSKPYYDIKFGEINNMVDGRQMGTAKVHPTASIAQNVFLGENVEVAEGVVINPGCVIMGESKIGKGTVLFPNVTIYSFVTIGKNCRIHSGTTVGSDGFGYIFDAGVHHKIWHLGGVIIEDNVEVGAATTIDCGTFSPTKIGAGSKIDNLVQIGHNDQLGNGVVVCGQAGIAGSVTIGNYCVLGGKSGAVHGISIADGTQVGGAAVVTGDTKPKEVLAGHPARPLKEWLRGVAHIRKLTKR
jgi:UDP-3-O-[3-hydroxymyristoyl] glucosamine N-acyltransferase